MLCYESQINSFVEADFLSGMELFCLAQLYLLWIGLLESV